MTDQGPVWNRVAAGGVALAAAAGMLGTKRHENTHPLDDTLHRLCTRLEAKALRQRRWCGAGHLQWRRRTTGNRQRERQIAELIEHHEIDAA